MCANNGDLLCVSRDMRQRRVLIDGKLKNAVIVPRCAAMLSNVRCWDEVLSYFEIFCRHIICSSGILL